MSDLEALQRAFQARVLAFQAGIESELEGRHDVDFEPRLDTYVDGYRLRLVEALGATYPVLQLTLGAAEFARLMREYIDRNPPRHYSVRDYGADIARQLGIGDTSGDGRRLGELARWEWTLADVFDAPDDNALEMGAMAGIPPAVWPDLSFELRACMRRFETATNVVEWWRAKNGLCAQPSGLMDAEPSRWLLWRRGVKTFFRSLDPIEAEALDAVAAGATFGELCERIAAHVDESQTALRAASLLRGWITEDLVTAYAISNAGE